MLYHHIKAASNELYGLQMMRSQKLECRAYAIFNAGAKAGDSTIALCILCSDKLETRFLIISGPSHLTSLCDNWCL